MELRWAPTAIADLQQIRAYIAHDKPAAAIAVAERLHEAAKILGSTPYAGRIGSVPGTRELVLPRLPYIIVYRVAAEHVDVLSVVHSARQRPTR